jgi:transcriptional regulator with XRE-family HTH domain
VEIFIPKGVGKMTIEEMKKWKRTLGMTSEEISSASGIPLSTVQKIFSGVTKSPRRATLDAILSALERQAEKDGLPLGTASAVHPSSADTESFGENGYETLYRGSLYRENDSTGYPDRLEESAGLYRVEKKDVLSEKKQGEYTLDDYYALPDERRVELIDGVIYDMAAPAIVHQKILG